MSVCPTCGEKQIPEGKYVEREFPFSVDIPLKIKVDQQVDIRLFFRLRFPVKIDIDRVFKIGGQALAQYCAKCGFSRLSFPSISSQ